MDRAMRVLGLSWGYGICTSGVVSGYGIIW